MSIILGAALAGSFKETLSGAVSSMGLLESKLSKLGENQKSLDRFGKLQDTMGKTAEKFNAARGRARELGNQMAATENPSERLAQQFSKAHAEADRLQNKLMGERRELGSLRGALSDAGINTRNFSEEQSKLAKNTEKLQQAQDKVARAQSAVDSTKSRLSNMKGDIVASAGIFLALQAPIKAAANFEQAMARVGAVSGTTGEDFAKLSGQARQLGRDTQFTATQAANSQEMLARAGFKTEEILQTMPALLNMAAAEGMDLAAAADIASSSLRGYQLAADQSGRVSDVLAKASAASNTGISEIGESMKMVAPIAAGLKIPFEETSAMIGIMANAGIKGSEAGTALRAALLRLSKAPKQTYAALEKLGVATRDANGNLRTMPSLMGALGDKMSKMGEADKMGELAKIFGTEATSGMLAIMEAAKSGGLKDLTGELQNAGGAAAKMAERMNETAQGALKRLGASTEDLMINIGDIFLPGFASGAETLAKFTGKVSDLTQKFPTLTKMVLGSVAAFGSYKVVSTGVGILKSVVKLPFQEAALHLSKLNAAYIAADGSLVTMIKGTKLYTAAQSICNAVAAANPILLVVLAVTALAGAFMWAYHECDWFREGVDTALTYIKDGAAVWSEKISDAIGWVGEKWDSLVGLFSAGGESLRGIIASIKEKFTAGFDKINDLIESVGKKWESFKAALGIAPKIPEPEVVTAKASARGAGLGKSKVAAIEEHAAGGIFTKPHFGLVAEAGITESVIPHNSGGERIWQATGEQAGFSMGGGSAFSPTFHINVTAGGDSNGGEIGRQIMREIETAFPRLIKRYTEQRERLAY
ncbi:MAG: phage tail tape measure protein [Synergistaceae bacterium]|nr:phage tail tape measure protein [Synergistaceae bacterium]